jgi:hypothetical protein
MRGVSSKTLRQVKKLRDGLPVQCNACMRTLRPASTLSSNTAVNATRTVPEKYRKLYTALGALRHEASAHVSLSRLQLALQGLESTSPRIRLAVLGVDVPDTAKQIVRLLLADPLEEQSFWEKQLTQDCASYENGVLLRYGQPANSNIPQTKTSIPTLNIPSSLLERGNLEILLSSVNSLHNGRAHHTPLETFLAPIIGTPTAQSGRQTTISQPVHRALIVAKNLEELFLVAELLASTEFISKQDQKAIRVVMQNEGITSSGHVLTVDVNKAERAISAIRKSLAEAPVYERQWLDSGMLNISDWITKEAQGTGAISPQIAGLISSVLGSAKNSVKAQADATRANDHIDISTMTNLASTIDGFSRNAHQELQSGLSSAWSSRNWRKLAWYKLFWRVDDVGLIVSDLITNAWLPQTEKAVYELSGRLSQAGISPMETQPSPVSSVETVATVEPVSRVEEARILQAQALASDTPAQPVITNTAGISTVELEPVEMPRPLSSSISTTRLTQISRAVNTLTSEAQQLVLRTLSITGLSAGLSGLTYMSLTPGSLYEAGTVLAVGVVYALWRMQGGWMKATRHMENELFDEGRGIIRRIVDRMHDLVQAKAKPRVDQAAVARREQALKTVETAEGELKKLMKEEK